MGRRTHFCLKPLRSLMRPQHVSLRHAPVARTPPLPRPTKTPIRAEVTTPLHSSSTPASTPAPLTPESTKASSPPEPLTEHENFVAGLERFKLTASRRQERTLDEFRADLVHWAQDKTRTDMQRFMAMEFPLRDVLKHVFLGDRWEEEFLLVGDMERSMA